MSDDKNSPVDDTQGDDQVLPGSTPSKDMSEESPGPLREPLTPERLTPMMRQFLGVKEKYKDEVLFFRMGDFYEMFHDDAVYASKVLGIALTKRGDGVPMCGVPYHAVANYIHPILDDGRNIAICEQMETPEEAQGAIVRREVVRVLTPGTIFEENMLNQGDSRLIAAAVFIESEGMTLYASADISTGDIWLEKEPGPVRFALLATRGIREVVMGDDWRNSVKKEGLPLYFRRMPPASKKEEMLRQSFAVENSQVLELGEPESDVLSLLLFYIHEVVPRLHTTWKKPRKEYLRKIMHLDETALKTLEIVSSQSGDKDTSLLAVVDKTITSAGRRLLIQMLMKPSTDIDEIRLRQEAVHFAMKKRDFVERVKQRLRHVYDIERIIALLQNHPQVRHLGNVLTTLEAIRHTLDEFKLQSDLPGIFQKYWVGPQFPTQLYTLLNETLYMENLPPLLDERRFILPGRNAELDELLNLGGDAGNIIINFEQREKQRLDINTLKVRYNKVIGYYIEISKGQADKAPPEYSRRQTLVNAERYTCEELKTLEDRILGARERIIDVQRAVFEDLVAKTLAEIELLRYWAEAVALCDVIFSFARTAFERSYVCPEVCQEGDLKVVNSRHPVVEHLFKDEVFVPNDIHLNSGNRHLAILTGPNMAGKSTYIRQVGLIQILAQAGSFVPADSARVVLADRIFTRIGAFDRLARGESTFYVEMAECARIFQNFTARSLILLDEIGRGTSTFDGISIARAMVEFLNDPDRGRPKTLFATHYGELSNLIEADRGIVGLTVQVLEENNRVVFLRKIIEGTADKSYGIYVAQLAGIPASIIERAGQLLKELEEDGIWSQEPVFVEPKSAPAAPKTASKPAPRAPGKAAEKSPGKSSKDGPQDQLSIF